MRWAQHIPENQTDDDGRSEIVLLVSVDALSTMSTTNIKCILNKVADQMIPIGY